MLEEPQIIHTEERRTAVVRLTIPRSEIGSAMGPAMGEVMAALQSAGVQPAGPAFSHHLRMDEEVFDLEVGVPVEQEVAAGRVQPSVLPATQAARAIYRGAYDGLGQAWAELDRWLATQGQQPAPDLWEYYLEVPADGVEGRTELVRPVADEITGGP